MWFLRAVVIVISQMIMSLLAGRQGEISGEGMEGKVIGHTRVNKHL
jgi:hypothetical protein